MGEKIEKSLLDLRKLQTKYTSNWEISEKLLKYYAIKVVSYKHPPKPESSNEKSWSNSSLSLHFSSLLPLNLSI